MTIMFDCAERIERMTKDLLDLSRVDREASGDFAPGAGLLACARMLGARLPVGVVLRTEVDDLAVVTGRGGDINHVFMNLMDNAMRAVEDTGTIEIQGVATRGEYVVKVGDSGTGIAPELFARVFEPFWTTRPAGAGTGLGLSLAKQIIDEHRGTIAVSASPLGGAHFTVRLPLRSVDQRAVA